MPPSSLRSRPPEGAAASSGRPGGRLDAAQLSKLRWRCRRGLLENDILIGRILEREEPVTLAEANGLYALMELADNDLLDLFLGRTEPEGRLDKPDVRRVLQAVREPRMQP